VTKNIVAIGGKTADGLNKCAYGNNYKGKNPTTRTQWKRFQRSKKATAESHSKCGDESVDPKGKQKVVEISKRPRKERLSLTPIKENSAKDDKMDSDFLDLESDFDVLCNVVSILFV